MFPILPTSLPLLFACFLRPTRAALQNFWNQPVDFNATKFWPSEPCAQSCLTGDQCAPCSGNSLSTWVGCTNNGCFCNNYATASFYLESCITANCPRGRFLTDPYDLIHNYCASAGVQVAPGTGVMTVATRPTATQIVTSMTVRLTGPPGETPTGLPVSSLCTPATATGSDTTAASKDTSMSRSDKIALGCGVPAAIAAVVYIAYTIKTGKP